jgi:hypothetical protein
MSGTLRLPAAGIKTPARLTTILVDRCASGATFPREPYLVDKGSPASIRIQNAAPLLGVVGEEVFAHLTSPLIHQI